MHFSEIFHTFFIHFSYNFRTFFVQVCTLLYNCCPLFVHFSYTFHTKPISRFLFRPIFLHFNFGCAICLSLGSALHKYSCEIRIPAQVYAHVCICMYFHFSLLKIDHHDAFRPSATNLDAFLL